MNQNTYSGVYPRQLQILLNSSVSHLIFTGTQFNGVQFTGADQLTRRAFARKEMITTLGMQSAPFLQRSGIGPSSILQQAGITPLLINENIGTSMGTDIFANIVGIWPNVTGIPTDSDVSIENFAFAFTEDPTPLGVPGQRAFVTYGAALGPAFALISVGTYDTKRLGQSTVASNNPLQKPLYVSNQLSDSDSLLSFRTALRSIMWGIFDTDPSFVPINIDNATLADDIALNAWIVANIVVANHYENQCPMGTSATNSVLDNRFRVWNTQGLRVCDLQSFGTKLAMHPSLSSMMIGNLCGRLILEDHGLLAPPLTKNLKQQKKHLNRSRKKRSK